MTHSVAIAEPLDAALQDHLLRHLRAGRTQEDLCFALWRPSGGSERATALLFEMFPPRDGERTLQGNVSFTAAYVERAVSRARAADAGVALLHSHIGPSGRA
jgi:molybdopterin-synthase adenylyltransferase